MTADSRPPAPPPHLFKYVSLETARVVLDAGRLRWTTPPLLNDPFDLSFELGLDTDPAEVRRAALELLWADYQDGGRPAQLAAVDVWKTARPNLSHAQFVAELGPGIDEALDFSTGLAAMNAETQKQLRVAKLLCLTEAPDNMLMWAHYAQQHGGAVLRFSSEGEGNAFGMARAVSYTSDMPRFADESTLAGLIVGRSVDSKRLAALQCFTKAADWSYEREWRILFGRGRDPGSPFEDLPFGEEQLTGLILGFRMPEVARRELIDLAKRLNPAVEVFHARPARREFRIEVAHLEGV